MATSVVGILRQVLTWIFTAFYVPCILMVCLSISREKRATFGPKMVRGWGKALLFIARVEVHITPAAQAALAERKARVLTFNHGSTLDVPLGASLLPDGGVLAIKEEMRKVPFLGRGCVALGSVFINRGNRDAAYASLEAGASRIETEVLQVLIAPEGTRSIDGSLGQFKKGTFHLAHTAQVPILPLVFHGCAKTWPMGKFAPYAGKVAIDVLEPVPIPRIDDGTPESLQAAAAMLRTRYEEALSRGIESPEALS